MSTAISVQQLCVRFRGRGPSGEVVALQPLDLEIERGRITGILGPNGSGKTTLLRVLAGLLRPTSGTATVAGLAPGDPALQRRLAFQPAGSLPLGVLSAREYLAWVGARLGLDNRDSDARAARWLERLDLADTGRRWLRTFSTGMEKRLALAAALLGDPEILLLDEPTSGLDPFGSEAVIAILRERAAAGTTVVMASHHLLEVEELCNEVLVLYRGAVRARGSLADLLGTDARSLVVRGLDDAAMNRLAGTATELGGEVVRTDREREHVFALFRRLAGASRGGSGTAGS
ncbi:MAG: ABC transporter ATP-binding protein [Planctomycetes bacterium]|nr:ABC transporter ATP-binding protein [Planctomycetota bacterium]